VAIKKGGRKGIFSRQHSGKQIRVQEWSLHAQLSPDYHPTKGAGRRVLGGAHRTHRWGIEAIKTERNVKKIWETQTAASSQSTSKNNEGGTSLTQ